MMARRLTVNPKTIKPEVVAAIEKEIERYKHQPANDTVLASLAVRPHRQRTRLTGSAESRLRPANDNTLAKKLHLDWLIDELALAAAILRRMPNQPLRGYQVAWPEIVRETHEAYGYDKAKRINAIPNASEIERMDRAINWLLLVPERERKIVWAYANGASYRMLGQLFGISHKTSRVDHYAALVMLAMQIYVSKGSGIR